VNVQVTECNSKAHGFREANVAINEHSQATTDSFLK